MSTVDNLTAVGDGQSDVLEMAYYYGDGKRQYGDDIVVTHDVVKYYGDSDTSFKVTVMDEGQDSQGQVFKT